MSNYSGQVMISFNDGKITHVTDKNDFGPNDAKMYIDGLGVKKVIRITKEKFNKKSNKNTDSTEECFQTGNINKGKKDAQ